MNLLESLRTAASSLVANKMRALLTMLGTVSYTHLRAHET